MTRYVVELYTRAQGRESVEIVANSAEEAATHLLNETLQGEALVQSRFGPGKDMQGPYLGEWTGQVGHRWAGAKVREQRY
jgi:hypothetical protein